MAATPALLDLAINADEERVDRAMRNLDEMLDGDDKLSKKEASFFVLRQSKRAAQRGWRQPDAEVNVNVSSELVTRTICWGNNEPIAEITATQAEWDLVDRRAGRRTVDGELADADAAEHPRINEERRQIAADAEEERRQQGDSDPS
jgi:hypothetical protein